MIITIIFQVLNNSTILNCLLQVIRSNKLNDLFIQDIKSISIYNFIFYICFCSIQSDENNFQYEIEKENMEYSTTIGIRKYKKTLKKKIIIILSVYF